MERGREGGSEGGCGAEMSINCDVECECASDQVVLFWLPNFDGGCLLMNNGR